MWRIVAILLTLSLMPSQAQTTENELFYQPQVEFSGNFSLVSNYLFRGETLSDDSPAVQGGLDYKSLAGYYIGTWLSSGSKSMPLEINLYGAYETHINDKLVLEAKLTGFIYPHASNDDSLETELSAHIHDLSFRYSYDFVLEQHYVEAGLRQEFSTAFWGMLRGGMLSRDNKLEIRTGSATNDTSKENIWDVEFNFGYMLNQKSFISGEYAYHETEASSVAINYTVLFGLL